MFASFLSFLSSKEDSIKNHYSTSILSAVTSPISDLTHRQIRFDLGNRFIILNRKIPDLCVLQDALRFHSPRNSYYSVSRWIEPQSVVPKYLATKTSENLFLGSDLAFDIDFKPFSIQNIEKARLNAVALLDFLAKKSISIKYIAFSGSKGFHVLCNDPNKYESPDPFVRESWARSYRKDIVSQIFESGITIDSRITIDTRRIIRIPGTINYSTGYLCRIVSKEEIHGSALEILKNTPRVSYSSLRTFWDDLSFQLSCSINRSCAKEGKFNSTYFSTFISSTVLGVDDRSIPILIYKNESLKNLEPLLRSVQSTYSLSDLYLFFDSTTNEHFVLSLDSLPRSRLLKISKAAKSLGYSKLFKYSQNWMRIEGRFDKSGKQISPKPKLVRVLQSPVPSIHCLSLGHLYFFKHALGLDIVSQLPPTILKHGSEEYRIIDAVLED